MLGSEKMALLALTLLMLTAAAHSSEIQAQNQFFNGAEFLQSLFTKLNITMPSVLSGLPGFANTSADSELDDAFRCDTVFSSNPMDRIIFADLNVIIAAYQQLYLYTRLLEIYIYEAWKTQTTNHQLGFLGYSDDITKSVKYFLTKKTWADAHDACIENDGALYTLDHSAELDKALAEFYTTEQPWFENQKLLNEGGTDLRCGYFKRDYKGFAMQWGSCQDLRPYICEYTSTGLSKEDNILKTSSKSLARISDLLPPVNVRYTQTSLGDSSADTYNTVKNFDTYSYDVSIATTTYNQLEYLAILQGSGSSVKFFLQKKSWYGAKAACEAEGSKLYRSDHSKQLDNAMGFFYMFLRPWLDLKKSGTENKAGPENCGLLRGDFAAGSIVNYADCSDLNYFVCEKITIVVPTTTDAPTTLDPTTLDPTTLDPTTLDPTTLDPTTLDPTTLDPTTLDPTTLDPTTLDPTTLDPTTLDPTTLDPTTLDPTTLDPTTLDPTTLDPTTLDPTTLDPTTLDPTTLDPTTLDPTTLDPTTLDPTTLDPTTLDPTTLDPTTEDPTTLDPTTLDPTTEDPTTLDPTTLDPTTLDPTTLDPTTLDPTTLDPTTLDPTTLDPTTSDPTTLDPTTLDPTTLDPTTLDPTTLDPTTLDPTTLDPTTEDPTTLDPTTLDPTTIEVITTTRRPRPTRPPRPTGAPYQTRPPRPTGSPTSVGPTRPTGPTTSIRPPRPTVPFFPIRPQGPSRPNFPIRLPRPTGAHHPTRPPPRPSRPNFPIRPPRPTRPNRPNRPVQQQVFLGQLASGQRYNVTVNVFVNSLRSLADAINSDNSIRSELRDLPELLLAKLIALGEKRVLFEERWPTMSEEDQLTFVTNIERYTEDLKKLVNERSLLTKYFSYNKGERQLITVKLDEMVEFMTPYF